MPLRTDYRERAPIPRLAAYVECFWWHRSLPVAARVLPDTCIDLIFTRATGLQLVGSMTRALVVESSIDPTIGIRVRAGAARSLLNLPVQMMRDEVLSVRNVWGERGRVLEEQLRNAVSLRESMQILESALAPTLPLSPQQNAIAYLAASGGRVCLDSVTHSTGLGLRQFRRRCLEETGLSPKHLARIGRFRHACSRIAQREHVDWPDLALDCGYYDQAHFINEFHEFSDLTPTAYWHELQL